MPSVREQLESQLTQLFTEEYPEYRIWEDFNVDDPSHIIGLMRMVMDSRRSPVTLTVTREDKLAGEDHLIMGYGAPTDEGEIVDDEEGRVHHLMIKTEGRPMTPEFGAIVAFMVGVISDVDAEAAELYA